MVWFTGTSTGNRYTVGQSYSMGGDVYVAQSDGSFENQRTGNSLVGSSEAPGVQWGGFSSLSGSGSSSGPGVASGGGSGTTGPGNNGAVSGGSPGSASGPGRPATQTVEVSGGGGKAGTVGGSGGGWLTVDKPLERIGHGHSQEGAGAISDIGWVKTQGGWAIVPSSDMKERMEDSLLLEIPWQVRNIVGPQFGFETPFPNFLGDRENYTFNSFSSEWVPKPGTVRNVGGGF